MCRHGGQCPLFGHGSGFGHQGAFAPAARGDEDGVGQGLEIGNQTGGLLFPVGEICSRAVFPKLKGVSVVGRFSLVAMMHGVFCLRRIGIAADGGFAVLTHGTLFARACKDSLQECYSLIGQSREVWGNCCIFAYLCHGSVHVLGKPAEIAGGKQWLPMSFG